MRRHVVARESSTLVQQRRLAAGVATNVDWPGGTHTLKPEGLDGIDLRVAEPPSGARSQAVRRARRMSSRTPRCSGGSRRELGRSRNGAILDSCPQTPRARDSRRCGELIRMTSSTCERRSTARIVGSCCRRPTRRRSCGGSRGTAISRGSARSSNDLVRAQDPRRREAWLRSRGRDRPHGPKSDGRVGPSWPGGLRGYRQTSRAYVGPSHRRAEPLALVPIQ